MEIYLAHPAVHGGVETRLDGARLIGELQERHVQLVVPATMYGTMNTIFDAQGPRTASMRLRVVRATDQVTATLIIERITRHIDGGATMRLNTTGPVHREGPAA